MRKLKPSCDVNSVELNSMPLLFNEKQAVKFLGVSLSFLRKSRSEGSPGGRTAGPPFVRTGRSVHYRRADLEAWVSELETRRVV